MNLGSQWHTLFAKRKVIISDDHGVLSVFINIIFTFSSSVTKQQVIGDATPDASKLMKREGVRSVPSFHYFKNGEKVDVVNGANAEAIEAAIKKHA